ncbi:hypothetical protein FOA52_008578 [Chlamydomonas sp. UWO 241]|nr:hypothetical protein FOA52_008578 [Chlamydomonas sp. UWO 241]
MAALSGLVVSLLARAGCESGLIASCSRQVLGSGGSLYRTASISSVAVEHEPASCSSSNSEGHAAWRRLHGGHAEAAPACMAGARPAWDRQSPLRRPAAAVGYHAWGSVRHASTSAAAHADAQPGSRPQRQHKQQRHQGGKQPGAPPSPPAPPSAEIDFEALAHALLQPLPLGRHTNDALNDQAVTLDNKTMILDPAKCLESTMRALYVIKKVLSDDGHVYVLNSNPSLQPLLREAALCCVNPNMWFCGSAWGPGSLDPGPQRQLFLQEHQPNRKLLAVRGLKMVNPHCTQPSVANRPPPKLAPLDKWRLFEKRSSGRGGPSGKELLKGVLALEGAATQLPLPRVLTGDASKLRLIVVLDLTHDLPAVIEAHARGVMTASLVNAHSDLSLITYPVFAGEYQLRYQHFLLDWILKVANVPPPGAQ